MKVGADFFVAVALGFSVTLVGAILILFSERAYLGLCLSLVALGGFLGIAATVIGITGMLVIDRQRSWILVAGAILSIAAWNEIGRALVKFLLRWAYFH